MSLTELRSVEDHSTHDSRFPPTPQGGHTFFFRDAHEGVKCVLVATTLFNGQSASPEFNLPFVNEANNKIDKITSTNREVKINDKNKKEIFAELARLELE